MNRCDLLQVKIQPTHRSGMGLKAIKPEARVPKVLGGDPSASSGSGFGQWACRTGCYNLLRVRVRSMGLSNWVL